MEKGQNQNYNKQTREKTGGKSAWDIRPYLSMGLTAVLVVIICIAIFFLIYRFEGLASGIGKILSSIQAIFIGFILAYLLNPIMKFFERLFTRHALKKGKERTSKLKRRIRAISVALAMAVFLVAISILVRLILPQLVQSIEELVMTMNEKVQSLTEWVDRLLRQNTQTASKVDVLIADASGYLEKWLQNNVLKQNDVIASVTTGVYNVIKAIFNAIIGLIISVYVLMTKETFIGQMKKIIYAVFRPRYGNVVMEVLRKADDVFGGFFIGKIIDSIIIGFICFGGLYVLRMPYTVLVSVIVGVTNVIPFFGPYIGAIPSAILIFLVNPVKGIQFIVFIIILQQVDGNIIGPKILGNTTGLSPFWVIFAILLFGGSFGVIGMLFGVPIFAVIYYVVKRIVEHILRMRKLPEETNKYVPLVKIDGSGKATVRSEEEQNPLYPKEHQKLKKKSNHKQNNG